MKNQRPILFNTEMVQAILDGTKTQTRRIVKPQPKHDDCFCVVDNTLKKWKYQFSKGSPSRPRGAASIPFFCPYGQPGDLLYVRETFFAYGAWVKNGNTKTVKQAWTFQDLTADFAAYRYYMDNPPQWVETEKEKIGWFKRPSLFMPKAAARIWLEITDVRVQRLQDITEEDAIAEGIENILKNLKDQPPIYLRYDVTEAELMAPGGHWAHCADNAVDSFRSLWQSINAERAGWDSNPWVWAVTFRRTEKPFSN